VGSNRVQGDLENQVQAGLRAELERPLPTGRFRSVHVLVTRGMTVKALAERRISAATALGRIAGTRFWTEPYGEAEWVKIPAGEFTMGDKGRDPHKLHLENYWISKVPITNTQYKIFIQETEHRSPKYWEENNFPKGKETHPVVGVDWYDAVAYCEWLSKTTGKSISLPTEAQWEKAARGTTDVREYPWGDKFDPNRCNCWELRLRDTTPVGIFPNGASPYGVLDMSGNVLEWCSTKLRDDYNQQPDDDLKGDSPRVLRGGSFNDNQRYVRCADRYRNDPGGRYNNLGFRVVLSPF